MRQKRTFYLYEAGEPSELLPLGTLVLQDYKNPLLVRHYTTRELSDAEQTAHTSTKPIKNAYFSNKRGWSPGASLEAADLVNFDLSHTSTGEKYVVAKTGQRVLLKEPEVFLTDIVLKEAKALEALKLWLSAARCDYMCKLKWLRKPKIWMLTGRYLLEDARSMVIYNHNQDGKVGISSTTVAALTGVAVGGSLRLGHNSEIKARMEMPGVYVWAARYHLLDTTYVKMKPADKPSLPVSISLHPDITSKGTLRKTDDDDVAQVGIDMTPDDSQQDENAKTIDENSQNLDDQLLDEYQETERYEDDLENAIKKFEEILKKASLAAEFAKSSGGGSEGDDDDEED